MRISSFKVGAAKHTIMFIIFLCVFGFLIQACSQTAPPPSPQETAQTAATAEPAKPSADSFIIKGVLLGKDGSPAAGKTISVHPLDNKGTPLFISIFEEVSPGKGSPKPWNPKAESGSDGRFKIEMPRISRLGDDPLKEVSLAVGAAPAGGWVAGKISKIYYANPAKKEDLCFIKDDARIQLLRKGNEVVKVKLDQDSAEIDVGEIGVQ